MKESKRARSRSTDHLPNINNSAMQQHSTELNSMSIRKMLRPVHTAPDSPVTSPENARYVSRSKYQTITNRLCTRHGHKMAVHHSGVQSSTNTLSKKGVRRLEKAAAGCMSEPEFYEPSHTRPSKARSEQRINGFQDQVMSPTSDEVDIFDSHCFATTPSSSNASDNEQGMPASPTSQLLIEYEEHLRNTLEKDSESYSLHTFEALLSRSMENLGKLVSDQCVMH